MSATLILFSNYKKQFGKTNTCESWKFDYTAWKVFKCGVISVPYLPVFSPNTGKYGPEITPYLDTFHVVIKW